MTVVRPGWFFAVVAVALALPAVASGALSPSDYRVQAGAVCAKAKAETMALGQSGASLTTANFLPLYAGTLAIDQEEYASLYALQAPASLVDAHRRALWALWQSNRILAGQVKKLRAGVDFVTALKENGATVRRLAGEWTNAWRDAGVPACGGGQPLASSAGSRAMSHVREAIPQIDAYANDNYAGSPADPDRELSTTDNGFSGMTIALLGRLYDANLLHYHLKLFRVTRTSYCVQSTVDGKTAFESGPGAPVALGHC
ncbi:MAG TPA: hypothetical protein VMT59_14905 [Gaiellaceae bacterium]|nr:hypothetical protein [Gaiellaceae bacterium]